MQRHLGRRVTRPTNFPTCFRIDHPQIFLAQKGNWSSPAIQTRNVSCHRSCNLVCSRSHCGWGSSLLYTTDTPCPSTTTRPYHPTLRPGISKRCHCRRSHVRRSIPLSKGVDSFRNEEVASIWISRTGV